MSQVLNSEIDDPALITPFFVSLNYFLSSKFRQFIFWGSSCEEMLSFVEFTWFANFFSDSSEAEDSNGDTVDGSNHV